MGSLVELMTCLFATRMRGEDRDLYALHGILFVWSPSDRAKSRLECQYQTAEVLSRARRRPGASQAFKNMVTFRMSACPNLWDHIHTPYTPTNCLMPYPHLPTRPAIAAACHSHTAAGSSQLAQDRHQLGRSWKMALATSKQCQYRDPDAYERHRLLARQHACAGIRLVAGKMRSGRADNVAGAPCLASASTNYAINMNHEH